MRGIRMWPLSLRWLLSDVGRSVYSMYVLDKGTIHVPGRTEQKGRRFYHTAPYTVQFKTHELFICGFFHLVFSDHG